MKDTDKTIDKIQGMVSEALGERDDKINELEIELDKLKNEHSVLQDKHDKLKGILENALDKI